MQSDFNNNESKAIALSQAGAAETSMSNHKAASEHYREAIALTEAAEEVNRETLSAFKAVYAVSEYRMGHPESAIEIMKEATDGDFATTQQLTTLANMQMATADFDGALTTTSRLKEKDNSVLGLNIEGAIHHRTNEYEAAIKAFSAALEINPDYPSALKNRAVSYINTRQFELAKLTFYA